MIPQINPNPIQAFLHPDPDAGRPNNNYERLNRLIGRVARVALKEVARVIWGWGAAGIIGLGILAIVKARAELGSIAIGGVAIAGAVAVAGTLTAGGAIAEAIAITAAEAIEQLGTVAGGVGAAAMLASVLDLRGTRSEAVAVAEGMLVIGGVGLIAERIIAGTRAAGIAEEQYATRNLGNKSFCQAILRNYLDSLPEGLARTEELASFRDLDSDAMEKFARLTIEALIRSEEDPEPNNTPEFLHNLLDNIRNLRNQYRALPPEVKRGFSLLKESKDLSELEKKARELAGRLIYAPDAWRRWVQIMQNSAQEL